LERRRRQQALADRELDVVAGEVPRPSSSLITPSSAYAALSSRSGTVPANSYGNSMPVSAPKPNLRTSSWRTGSKLFSDMIFSPMR
jgi:hypothetical protein